MGSGWARTVFMGMDRRRFFGERGSSFWDFVLMVIGDWNCHYRHSSLRWKKDVELELYPKVFIITARLFFLKTEP